MRKFAYLMWLPFLVGAALTIGACQSATTEDEESLDVDDFIDSAVTPDPIIAAVISKGNSMSTSSSVALSLTETVTE